MKNLKIEFTGSVEQAEIVTGKNGEYVKLEIKQGFNKMYTFSRNKEIIDLMPSKQVVFTAIIREFQKKHSLEITGYKK